MIRSVPLTVVIPTYNCERFVAATLQSALCIRDAFILVADDASLDGTTDIVRRYVDASNGRIGMIKRNVNVGMAANWQMALSEVKTPFALKLDGDDIVFPDYVASAVDALLGNTKLGIVGGSATRIDSRQFVSESEVEQYLSNPLRPFSTFHFSKFLLFQGQEAADFLLRWLPYPCSSTTIYRMDAWRSVGGFFDKLKWCADREIWFRIARNYSIGFHDSPSAFYRVHEDNVTAGLGRSDMYCYDLDLMFRQARVVWPERELKIPFRREIFKVSKAYLGSSYRCIKAGRKRESIPRIIKGIRAFLYGAIL